MKRKNCRIFFAIVTLIAVILGLAACTEKEETPTAVFDAEEAFGKLLTDVRYAEALEDVSDTAEFTFPDLPANTDVRMYAAESGAYADRIIMIKAADEKDVGAVKAAAEKHLEELSAQLKDYNPEEVPKVGNAVVYTNGVFVFVCVTDDADTVKNILR